MALISQAQTDASPQQRLTEALDRGTFVQLRRKLPGALVPVPLKNAMSTRRWPAESL